MDEVGSLHALRGLALAPASSYLLIAPLIYITFYYQGQPAFFLRHFGWRFRGDLQRVSVYYRRLAGCAILGFVPFVISIVSGHNPLSLGLGLGRVEAAAVVVVVGSALIVPLMYAQGRSKAIAEVYPEVLALREGGTGFAGSVLTSCIYIAGYEYFWRGYLLFGLASHPAIGDSLAILIANCAFTLVHIAKPQREAYMTFVAGLLLASLALYLQSILAGAILHAIGSNVVDFSAARHHWKRRSQSMLAP